MEKVNMAKTKPWKMYAIKLLMVLESANNHNKLLMQCIRDIDKELQRETKFKGLPLDDDKQ
jgi:hypothetical protein